MSDQSLTLGAAVSWADPRTGETVLREEAPVPEQLEARTPPALEDAMLLVQAV